MKPSLPSYVCFMNIFNKYIEHTKSDYDSILHKIDTIVERIHKHFKYSDEQNLILEKNREKSKAIAGDHAAMTVKQIQTKKELKEIESNLADGMNEYGDEQAALLRLNMAIVEERACQWSLFQVYVLMFTIKSFDKVCRDPGSKWGHLDRQFNALPTDLSRRVGRGSQIV